jgi:hypothetical protein
MIPNSSLNVSGYIFYSDAPKDTFKTKKLVKLGRLDNAEPIPAVQPLKATPIHRTAKKEEYI